MNTKNNHLPILKINQLKKYYVKKNFIGKMSEELKAVDGVSLELFKGESLGIVGESGCGKTTMALLLMGLVKATSGEIFFKENNISNISLKEFKRMCSQIQMVFQDPATALDPRMTVQSSLLEPFKIQKINVEQKIIDQLLQKVGLSSEFKDRFPHEISGGQKQRVVIARALALNPEVLVLDEPTSALDVNVQSQILNLLVDLKNQFSLSYIFISHDLSVVKCICSRIAVMYLGKIVEIGDTDAIFKHPLHPYTIALFSNIPSLTKKNIEKIFLKGEIPSPTNIPEGCPFHTRCWKAIPICKKQIPQVKEIDKNHKVACHLVEKVKK